MFVLPPTNHLALGTFHSSTLSQRLNQCSCSACLPQKRSGLSIDSRYIFLYSSIDLIRALAANSGGGGKTRFSCIVDSIDCSCAGAAGCCAWDIGALLRNSRIHWGGHGNRGSNFPKRTGATQRSQRSQRSQRKASQIRADFFAIFVSLRS